jgi:hypothetical protein
MLYQDINFEVAEDGCRIYAICQNKKIGSIFFIKIGADKIMISDAEIEPEYVGQDVELYLTQYVIEMARTQHRKVMTICPYISEVFKRHPEFDDVRLLNQGR